MSEFIEVFKYVLKGLNVSATVYAATILISIPLGIVFAIGKVSKIKPIQWILGVYTWLLRGTPLLLQLYFVAFGIPILFPALKDVDRIVLASVAFIINYAAYFTEIFRGGILSIDKGHFEAGKALGMPNHKIMSRIIVPQALKKVLPSTGNEAITLIKDTALVGVIALEDIFRHAKEVSGRTMKVDGYIAAGIIYLIITYLIVYVFKKLEERYSYYD